MNNLLVLSCSLFLIGICGIFLSHKNLIIILLALELILLAANINFVVFSIYNDDLVGHIYTLLILTIGATESAIGLGIVIVYFRLKGGISVDLANKLQG
jgi:NADH-quinone oxidoreductase subunit K